MEKEFMDENYSTKAGVYENLLIEQQAVAFAIHSTKNILRKKVFLK